MTEWLWQKLIPTHQSSTTTLFAFGFRRTDACKTFQASRLSNYNARHFAHQIYSSPTYHPTSSLAQCVYRCLASCFSVNKTKFILVYFAIESCSAASPCSSLWNFISSWRFGLITLSTKILQLKWSRIKLFGIKFDWKWLSTVNLRAKKGLA